MDSVCEVFSIASERGVAWRGRGGPGRGGRLPPALSRQARAGERPQGTRLGLRAQGDGQGGSQPAASPRRVREECRRTGAVAMGYTKFCGDYGSWTRSRNLTKRIEHKAGRSCEVDWSGPTLGKGLMNPATGEVSQDIPARRRPAIQPEGLLRADAGHERADLAALPCAYARVLGRRARAPVCDNLKTGGQAPARGRDRAQRRLRGSRRALYDGHHARRVRKPKQKASAEGTVRDAATW